ncbi:polymerase delta-interacting protein 2-like [Rhipicephalus sanguineus]|uniref:polymerase delta-interacting protein 2-like n=1 Tax=Rhipicephalus sanguineus TaxID=34632 RepID=UPI0018933BE7|nr:polymerase delta-interacting protein 2-like [Rhipicephalus sanguineus]
MIGSTWQYRASVKRLALLHPAGEPGRPGSAATGTPLAHLQPTGTLETVRGRGVVGQEPILSKSQPAFQYSSHVSLQAPSGHMWGTFRMEREDGFTFDCRIPPFSLESKQEQSPQPAAV